MEKAKNILFIMCDQLRWDYLSCYEHPHLETPNIDWLAEQGVRFDRAYVQSPLCGPSRASFLTGRYVSSHGCTVNSDTPRPGEKLMGHYLNGMGVRTAVIGKSAVRPNMRAIEELDIDPESAVGQALITGGFEEVWRDDGISPDPISNPNSDYNRYLREQGYDNVNPWDRNANGAVDEEGNHLSGWSMRYAAEPANIAEEHSETAFATNHAIEFIEQADTERPWCLHLSYIKPHWPFVVPAPYHNIYGVEDMIPVVQDESERGHPVVDAFRKMEVSENFSRQEVRETVIPTYMGLVKQIDDHLGRVFDTLKAQNQLNNTLIVFTSDHGEYFGDHYLGEKYLFHDASVRIPLIVFDPSPEAADRRGTVCSELVEGIDLLPTFIDFQNGHIPAERIEGRSLLPLLRQTDLERPWRDCAISEIDYSDTSVREILQQPHYDCKAYMACTKRWKYILYEGYRSQLFDLENDPQELVDLGEDNRPELVAIRQEMHERLFRWLRGRLTRTTTPYEDVLTWGTELDHSQGVIIGRW